MYSNHLATGKNVTVTWYLEWTDTTTVAGERLIILTVSSQMFI